MSGLEHSALLRTLPFGHLMGGYVASPLRVTPKLLPTVATSHILRTLSEIPKPAFGGLFIVYKMGVKS